MKSISLTLLLLLFCVNFYAQDKTESTDTKFNFEIGHDDCGDPASESQTYAYRQGKVIKIIASNKILFEQNSVFGHKDKEKFTVVLVGIDANQNKKNIEDFLKKNVLNQSVQIVGNTQRDKDKKFGGLITLFNDSNEDIDELSEYLLENGIAKYKSFYSANLVPYTTPCILEKAEKRAKEAKLGIWAK
jgi:endonuclease YncB( thermonuclease family)